MSINLTTIHWPVLPPGKHIQGEVGAWFTPGEVQQLLNEVILLNAPRWHWVEEDFPPMSAQENGPWPKSAPVLAELRDGSTHVVTCEQPEVGSDLRWFTTSCERRDVTDCVRRWIPIPALKPVAVCNCETRANCGKR